MELDDLKDIWKEVGEKPILQQQQPLMEMLSKPSHSPIAKMKRYLLAELVLLIVLLGACAIYYFIAFKGTFSIFAWMYIIIAIAFGIYYYYKNKLLNEMQCSNCMVKANLERQVNKLQKFVRAYLLYGTLLLPVVILFLWIVLYSRLPHLGDWMIFFPSNKMPLWETILINTVSLTLVTIILYYLNKGYINKLYGRHIKRLREIIREMNDE